MKLNTQMIVRIQKLEVEESSLTTALAPLNPDTLNGWTRYFHNI